MVSTEKLKNSNFRGKKSSESAFKSLGRYDIVLDEEHFSLVLNAHTSPPPFSKQFEASLLKVCFPPHQVEIKIS